LFDFLNDFYIAYLNDILIYFKDPLKHDLYVCRVLDRLREMGLQVNIKKSEFKVTRIKYLGFIIFINNIEVDPVKVKVMKD
jgi:hypothetical protein